MPLAIPALWCEWACALVLSAGPVPITIEADPTPVVLPGAQPTVPAVSSGVTPQEKPQPTVQAAQADVLTSLHVQQAIRESRLLLGQKKYADAVSRLEPLLSGANGSEAFLETLEIAYRGQLAELLAQGDAHAARLLAERLRTLSSRDIPDVNQMVRASTEAANVLKAIDRWNQKEDDRGPGSKATERPLVSARAIAGQRVPYEARGKIDEEPLQSASFSTPTPRQSLFAQAETMFEQKRYAEALELYEKAYEDDPLAVQDGRERWGYCLLYSCVQKYNNLVDSDQEVGDAAWTNLESDVKLSRRLAPTLKYADDVLAAIDTRRSAPSRFVSAAATAVPVAKSAQERSATKPSLGKPAPASVTVTHHTETLQGWSIAETKSFRIFHRDRALAEEVARLSEEARVFSHRKWFPDEPMEVWQPKCDVFLYPTGAEYSRATGVGPQSPGHSKVQNEGGRILSRCVELRVDDSSMKDAVLPHEITHVVMAGRFGVHSLPRWADEGLAVLTEPRGKQDAHLANLAQKQDARSRFTCAQLMTMQEYPPGSQMRDFYAQSVGVCRYLVEKGGSAKLIAFIRLALQSNNYELALQQTYGMQSFRDLEQEFNGFVAQLPVEGHRGIPVASAR